MTDKIEVTQADKNCARNIRNAWDVNCNTAFEIAALHRLAHTQQSDTPVAWMYEQNETCTMRDKPFIQFNRAHMDPKYWTETPLYAGPPATDVAALVEAAKEARAELEAYEQDRTGETYNNPKLNAALAPFTKGQP